MRKPFRMIGSFAVLGPLAALGVAAAPTAGAQTHGHGETVQVVAEHLNNPRGLAPAPHGGLYLAEAGSGGDHCFPGGPEGQSCVGRTGSVDLVTKHGVQRLVTGLISGTGGEGVGAEGPVSVSAGPGRWIYAQFGLNSHVVPPAGVIPDSVRTAALAQLGHLALAGPHGAVRDVSDVGDQDWAWTKNHHHLAPNDFPDANPNAVLYSHGHRYVVDAGANALVEVQRNGMAKVIAFFPVPKDSQSDAVPTCVARGPDGALYVGELLGGFYAPGHARIWRVVPGHSQTIWATGLSTVQGCGFDAVGAFYATEFQTGGLDLGPDASPAGDVVRIGPHGHRTHLGAGQLSFPSGFTAGRDDAIYVSNCSIAPASGMGQLCPTGGQVVRITAASG